MKTGNLFDEIPESLPTELTQFLLTATTFRIERIVSKGHQSPPDFWYDQDEHEWVLLIAGEARLRFKDDDRVVQLGAGMYLNIPAHVQHRVDWTVEDQETIWLAVFYR
ncbi:cupin domain-containing protein [soil metagenome]